MWGRVCLKPRGTAQIFALLVALAFLAACGKPRTASKQPPVAIEKGDISLVTGMFITEQPGPRGEAYLAGVKHVLKFGSTRDLFAYVIRPDVALRLESVYAQDTSRIAWAHPSNAAQSFTDARTAYYVAWQPFRGATGPTFASFAKRSDAEAFVEVHGGGVLRFTEITPELVSGLTYSCPPSGSPLHRLASEANCVTRNIATPSPSSDGAESGKR